ncbi:hypothetical protein KSS87_023318, partial [Heliosperma pusillum]
EHTWLHALLRVHQSPTLQEHTYTSSTDKSRKSTTAPLPGARKDDIANRTNVCLNSSSVNPLLRSLVLTAESGIGSLLLIMLYLSRHKLFNDSPSDDEELARPVTNSSKSWPPLGNPNTSQMSSSVNLNFSVSETSKYSSLLKANRS